MPRLLFLTTNLFGSGGVSRILSVKTDFLIKKYGYDIHIIDTGNSKEFPFYDFNKEIIYHKIRVINFGFKHLFSYRRELLSIVKQINPDIIINCDNGLKGTLLPFLINNEIPLIYEKHGSKKIKSRTAIEGLKIKLSNVILGHTLRFYKAFIVLNEDDRKEWKGENVFIIENPLCIDSPSVYNDLQNKVAIAVGRYSPEKQFEVLLKIWKEIVKIYPNWILEIYGDTNSNLKYLIEHLKIKNNVTLKGLEKNEKVIYSQASMLLNTSSSEAFGLTIIEAMSFGIPVIAFNNTHGPKSIIRSNENGILVEKGNYRTYIREIISLIESNVLRERLGRNAIVTAQNYKVDKIMSQWHDLYLSII